jgi:hypothetical protein
VISPTQQEKARNWFDCFFLFLFFLGLQFWIKEIMREEEEQEQT